MPRSAQRKVRKQSTETTLLIDADVLAYQAANGEQRVTDWGDGVTSVAMGTLEQGVEDVLNAAEHLKEKLDADKYVLCLTHSEQYRKKLLPTYKANRGNKPILVDPIRDELVASHGGVRRPGLEGDDIMGIYATHRFLIPGKKIIVSIDKDMAQIPGTLYNPGRDTLVEVTREDADYLHMMQTLTGDPTDNYKGCIGVGPVKARKILDDGPAWPAIVAAYEERGQTAEDALIQARVAKILRATDFNFKTREPILWTPPK
jgi:DNA polymerase I